MTVRVVNYSRNGVDGSTTIDVEVRDGTGARPTAISRSSSSSDRDYFIRSYVAKLTVVPFSPGRMYIADDTAVGREHVRQELGHLPTLLVDDLVDPIVMIVTAAESDPGLPVTGESCRRTSSCTTTAICCRRGSRRRW